MTEYCALGIELTKDQHTATWDVDDEEDLSCTSNSTLQLSQVRIRW